MLSQLGVAWCLTAGPLVAACLMAATALYPNTYMIGIGEIIRKVSLVACISRFRIEVHGPCVKMEVYVLRCALKAASSSEVMPWAAAVYTDSSLAPDSLAYVCTLLCYTQP